MTEQVEALVIGAGPAGLMAAEALADAGRSVVVVDAKPSAGRKFLMAGKSGLNLTKAERLEDFLSAYAEASEWLAPMLHAFGPEAVQSWARGLGQEVFVGSSGRVFPVRMKGSPLLRAWLNRLQARGVEMRYRWVWRGFDGPSSSFDTSEGEQAVHAKATLLALGGASWARLGSDGAWAGGLATLGVGLDPFRPANVGLKVAWSPHMARHFGMPVKGAALTVDGRRYRGEFVISERGLEGSGIYAVSRPAREEQPIHIDLMPDLGEARIRERLARPRGKLSRANHLRRALGLAPEKLALLQEFGKPLPPDEALPALIKALPLRHAGPRPLDEAISVAGGVRRDSLDENLMLKALPGVFCAGEMLSWEAPTGGYLLTACFATGLHAGKGAVQWLAETQR